MSRWPTLFEEEKELEKANKIEFDFLIPIEEDKEKRIRELGSMRKMR